MKASGEVSFLVDTLLVETILAEPHLYKTAGFAADLTSKVQEYVEGHIDPQNPTKSVIDMLAPGALWFILSGLGLGKIGFLAGLLMNVFHVHVGDMLSSLSGKVKGMIGDGKKVSSAQIDAATEETIKEHSPSTPDEIVDAYKKLQSAPPTTPKTSSQLLRDARIMRLALIDYEDQSMRLTKIAFSFDVFRNKYPGTKAGSVNLFGRIFGWVLKVVLFSAGLMVAGDVVNKILGRPNTLDRSYQAGKETTPAVQQEDAPAIVSTQKKYPLKGDAKLPSALATLNEPENIDSMIVQFAKDTYSGLDGKENIIRNTPGFQEVKDRIIWFNMHGRGNNVVLIPPLFSSKKKVVDYFIDDVAKNDSSPQHKPA